MYINKRVPPTTEQRNTDEFMRNRSTIDGIQLNNVATNIMRFIAQFPERYTSASRLARDVKTSPTYVSDEVAYLQRIGFVKKEKTYRLAENGVVWCDGRRIPITKPTAIVYQSKWHNVRTEVDGITFDSKIEAERYKYLKLLEKEGTITNLRHQVKYPLFDKWEDGEGKTHRSSAYFADFVYDVDGEEVIEDVKGKETDVFKLKRTILHYKGIEIRIIKKYDAPVRPRKTDKSKTPSLTP